MAVSFALICPIGKRVPGRAHHDIATCRGLLCRRHRRMFAAQAQAPTQCACVDNTKRLPCPHARTPREEAEWGPSTPTLIYVPFLAGQWL